MRTYVCYPCLKHQHHLCEGTIHAPKGHFGGSKCICGVCDTERTTTQVNPVEIPNGDRPASEMTKREMIASTLASGAITSYDSISMSWIVATADELLAELEKTKEEK